MSSGAGASAALVDATGPLRPAALHPSISKSDAQRALVLSYALGADLELPPSGWPDDLQVLSRGLEQLPRAASEPQTIDCRDGGAPFRFLLSQAAITLRAQVRFVGSKRLGERPRAPLLSALVKALGAHGFRARFAGDTGQPWPLDITGVTGTGDPRFEVDASESSQFASSLVLAACALARRENRPWTVALEGHVASEPYLDLTLRWARAAGIAVRSQAGEITVESGSPVSQLPGIPGDWSSIGYLLPIAWRTGGAVAAVDLRSEHPDREMVRHLQSIGLALVDRPEGLAVEGEASGALDASGRSCPDLLPTLAAVACVLPAPSLLRDVGILRAKESDRLAGVDALVRAFGAAARREGDDLWIQPAPRSPQSFDVDSRGDHRMAMAGATLAVLGRCRARISDPACVSKSFPGFWTELQKTGVRVSS
ncbi:MAG TPA: 3-phosphoshikimate 1-carboxyvinyltransferase [Myxococcales bacterium]|nr:3-phosphoshikimate 1-carboxyvinyltransferase [Myxococcales bacterium]